MVDISTPLRQRCLRNGDTLNAVGIALVWPASTKLPISIDSIRASVWKTTLWAGSRRGTEPGKYVRRRPREPSRPGSGTGADLGRPDPGGERASGQDGPAGLTRKRRSNENVQVAQAQQVTELPAVNYPYQIIRRPALQPEHRD